MSVFPKTIDKATLHNTFAKKNSYKIQDVRKTLPLFILNNDVCTVLQGFYSFRTLSCDKVKHLINRLPIKYCNLDPIPATCFLQCADLLTPVITKIINVLLNSDEYPELLKHAFVRPLLMKPNEDSELLQNYRPL